jgi:very-short-patch-repair endonuclease
MRLRRHQLGVQFRRQHPIGPYIVNFCCIERMLIIELDGGQHEDQRAQDAARTPWQNGQVFLNLPARFPQDDAMYERLVKIARFRAELIALGADEGTRNHDRN